MNPDPSVEFEGPPDRFSPTLTVSQVPIPTSANDETDELWFAPDVMIETEWGYGEGYYRHFFETPETISWSCGKSIINDSGIWERPQKSVHLPWPLKRAVDDNNPMPEYHAAMIGRLQQVQEYLHDSGSFVSDGQDMQCPLCDYEQSARMSGHYLLNLEAFNPPTELRWPTIYKHLLSRHRVLPSKMFATILLEKPIDAPSSAVSTHAYQRNYSGDV